MKLSEMNTAQATDVIVLMAEPVSHLCDDTELVNMVKEFSEMKGIGILGAIGKLLPKLSTYLLIKHREDVYAILGALNCISAEQVGKLPFKETIKLIRESYEGTLKDFFTSSATAEETNVKPLSD